MLRLYILDSQHKERNEELRRYLNIKSVSEIKYIACVVIGKYPDIHPTTNDEDWVDILTRSVCLLSDNHCVLASLLTSLLRDSEWNVDYSDGVVITTQKGHKVKFVTSGDIISAYQCGEEMLDPKQFKSLGRMIKSIVTGYLRHEIRCTMEIDL